MTARKRKALNYDDFDNVILSGEGSCAVGCAPY